MLSPTEWFDQFPPLKEGVVWPVSSQWCARHWSPCPILHGNGIGASLELNKIFVDEMFTGNDFSADEMNRQMIAASPLCCKLGDERMFKLWAHWPPPGWSPKPEYE